MKRLNVFRERFRNYPGRESIQKWLKRTRRAAFGLLPHVGLEDVGEVVFVEAQYSRWDALPQAAYANIANRVKGDRETRLKRLTRFEGDLLLDPNGRQIFHNRRVVWGSYDLTGREREPHISSFFRKPTMQLPEFASLIGAYDNNYFHFIYDTMAKIALMERYAPKGTPLVIGEALARQRFFQDARRMGVLGDHPFVIQTSSLRLGGSVAWVPSPGEPRRDDLIELARRFGANDFASSPALRLYLTRGPNAANARRLRNEADLFSELSRRGFIFFDAQEHDLSTQVRTFARAELVVSPHGAGLTNVIWRQGRPLTVVELVNPTLHTFDMAYLSAVLGYDHHMVDNRGDVGQPLRASADADIEAALKIVDAAIEKNV